MNLDPFTAHHCTVEIASTDIGLGEHERFQVKDLLTGDSLRVGRKKLRATRPDARSGAHLVGREGSVKLTAPW